MVKEAEAKFGAIDILAHCAGISGAAGDFLTLTDAELPVGWQRTWHENPKPQWIVPLSGTWFVEKWMVNALKWDRRKFPLKETKTQKKIGKEEKVIVLEL